MTVKDQVLPTLDHPVISRVRLKRADLGLNNKQMAVLFGVDYQTYDAWEQGISRPSKIVNRFLDIIDLLGIFHPVTLQRIIDSLLDETERSKTK
jgi:DNA-binding transcriptional regulator YiaG